MPVLHPADARVPLARESADGTRQAPSVARMDARPDGSGPVTLFVRHVFPLLALAVTLVLLVREQTVPEMGSDTWLHLRLGDELRAGWSVARPGHLSGFDSAEWYPSQWLSQMGMSWTADTFGLPGVVWLAGVLVLGVPLALYVACRRWAGPLPAAAAAVTGTFAAAPGLSARPQVVSYLLIVLVTCAWLTTMRDGRARWWLVVVAWAWAPFHGMWVVGVSIGLAAVLGMALARDHGPRHLARLAAIPVLSGVVPVLSPLGLHVYDTVLGVGARNARLTEWAPPNLTSPHTLVLAAMVAVVLVTALRGASLDWPTVMVLGLAMVWGLYSVRTTIVAGLILTPLLAMALQRLVPQVGRSGWRERATVGALGLAAVVALGVVATARGDQSPVSPWVDERLDAMPAGTKVLDDWELGHWALWRHPQLDLVMHGYVDVFTVGELERNIGIVASAPGWDRAVADLGVDYAMVDPDSQLGYGLTELLGWTVVEADEDLALLVPPAS